MTEKKKTTVKKTVKKKPVMREPVGPHAKRTAKVTATTLEPFVDGTLGDAFRELGYDVHWNRGETREIPKWLYERCVQSGAEFV